MTAEEVELVDWASTNIRVNGGELPQDGKGGMQEGEFCVSFSSVVGIFASPCCWLSPFEYGDAA